MENGKINKSGRIVFVEPNDIYDEINGNPFTPDYTDYCISFNLVVDVYSRFKGESGTDKNLKYVISWVSKSGDETDNNHVSFLQGEDAENFNFLSTYYTDIDFEDVRRKNIVEGLGIENISVSFESYYAPTVSIKFVDVRGSSLFGREESIYSGKSDRITSESVFGCFFTIPYPKFKLQIKGFYGKPVTYQLTCSGFKGNFNSKTGNFEAVATFIGYSYSLLTDIPMSYLAAAPYSDYVGAAYWESMVNSEEWALADGVPPIKLFEYIREIKSSTCDTDNNIVSNDESDNLNRVKNEIELIDKIKTSYDKLKAGMREKSSNYIEDKENEDFFYMFDQKSVLYGDKISHLHEDFLNRVNEYNEKFYNSTKIDRSKLPNQNTISVLPDNEISSVEFCDLYKDSKGKLCVKFKGGDITVNNISNFRFNDNRNVGKNIARMLVSYMGVNESKQVNNISKYGYVVNCNGLSNFLNSKKDKLNEKVNSIRNNIEERKIERQKSSISVEPYIGNIVKIIMCHLETFSHMMYSCYNNIKNSNRNPSYLGVNIENTDVVGCDTIPPWPMCYNNGNNGQNGNVENNDNVIAWVGDFSPNFEEEKLIKSLQKAVTKTINSEPEVNELLDIDFIPLNSSDFGLEKTPFSEYTDCDLSGLSGVLSLRAASLFGIMRYKNPEILGKIDAINYFISNSKTGIINSRIFDSVGNSNINDVIYNISLCNEKYDIYGEKYSSTGKNRHKFETVPSIKYEDELINRHPMFKEMDDSELNYMHYLTLNKSPIIPSHIKNFNDYRNDYSYDSSVKRFKILIGDDLKFDSQYFTSTEKLLSDYDIDIYKIENDSQYNIITDKNTIEHIDKQYELLKSGVFEINDKEYKIEGCNKVIEDKWRVELYNDFYTECYNVLDVDVENIIGKDGKKLGEYIKKTVDNPNNDIYSDFVNNDNCYYDKSKDRFVRNYNSSSCDVDPNKLFVNANQVIIATEFNKPVYTNIFGNTLYYLQNEKINVGGYNEEINNDLYKDRSSKSKVFLFLHTLSYNMDYSIIGDKNTINYVPYLYLVLLGGYIWRRRFFINHNTDPIVTCRKDYGIYYSKAFRIEKDEIIDYAFFVNGKFTVKKIESISYDKNSTLYTTKVSDLFNGYESIPDAVVSNKLERIFNEFVYEEYPNISSNLELKQVIFKNLEYIKKDYNGGTFSKDINEYYKLYRSSLKVKIDENGVLLNNSYIYGINRLYINGRPVFYDGYVSLQLILSKDNMMCSRMREMYMQKAISIWASNEYCSSSDKTNYIIDLDNNTFKNYIEGFTSQLKDMCQDGESTTPSENTENRNVCISMYMYLKNLWDKWLVCNNEDDFTVKNYFSNFIFIDSFYHNIFKKLYINLSTFVKIFEERSEKTTIYSFLSDLSSETHCLFLSMPDYIDLGSSDLNNAVNSMESIFRPIPFNQQDGISTNNKFIFIYTHKPSDKSSEQNNYRSDSFDIWANGEITSMANKLFSSNDENNADQITRYGYNVPSFGISYSRQNNHLFKDMKLDMNNPVETEQSIKTLTNIAAMGSGNSNKNLFVGQDIYPIFCNYSYTCEVEMMGDAQIMPLMYFQLMNIPMWRGTYMIFNVTHNMTPGNMTTTFKGMKMACNSIPYSDEWVITENGYSPVVTRHNYSNGSYSEYRMELDKTYDKISDTKTNYFSKTAYASYADKVNPKIVNLYNCLCEEIKNLPENKDESNSWTVTISHLLRKKTKGSNSDHIYGNAMDLQIKRTVNGKVQQMSSGKDQHELVKVFDILYCCHRDIIRQCILEYPNKKDIFNESTRYNFHVLHVAVLNNVNHNRNDFFIASCDNNYTDINKAENDYKWFLECVPYEFRKTAKRCWNNDRNNFFNNFLNYRIYSKRQNLLKEHFNDSEHVYNRIKNNNPTNLRVSSIDWLGKIESSNGFEAFSHMKYGIRAGMLNINSKVKGHNNDISLSELIHILTPKGDGKNDPVVYSERVAKELGIQVSHRIPLLSNPDSADFYKKLVNAMSQQEHSERLFTDDLDEGYKMAYKYVISKK